MRSRHSITMTELDDPRVCPKTMENVILAFVVRRFLDGRRNGIGAQTPLVTSGIIDSTGVVELVEFLEARFGIEVSGEDVVVENFDSLRALARLVRGRPA